MTDSGSGDDKADNRQEMKKAGRWADAMIGLIPKTERYPATVVIINGGLSSFARGGGGVLHTQHGVAASRWIDTRKQIYLVLMVRYSMLIDARSL